MRFIADFHIHSRYSRATSPAMEVGTLAKWAKKKGIGLIGTGDFTHPLYFSSLKAQLEPEGNGLFQLKGDRDDCHFILTAEVSNIFSQGGRLRKIHNLIFAPGFEVVEKINARLGSLGKLASDGRPIFGLPARDLVKMVMDISPDCLIVPAHAWTPWFSIFGANSGFDSIEECFGDEARHIYAIETGLSSNPAMNWRCSSLDRITLLSNSDAHSPGKIGREANLFDCDLSYYDLLDVIRKKDKKRFLSTIEFFPEEGKYHYDGHRECDISMSSGETKINGDICPVCSKRITVGVMHRVEDLADRKEGFIPDNAIPFKSLIPLEEIIAEALGRGTGTQSVNREYERLISEAGNEFKILLDLSRGDLSVFVPPKILEGIIRVREGRVKIIPGYDGLYGKVKIFDDNGDKTP
ncbi:MAG TPA: endonuclease Q family protein [Nitrospiria bacterium]|nr:endonuclease Q family protein [Nitrospiria bacterium]